tara:strand:- start:141 stop:1844 length:1704 start_codon:yes stop_codon:yes gene_type:complete
MNNNLDTKQATSTENDDINFNLIFLTLSRKKRLFIKSFIIIQIISLAYTFSRRPLWEGQFQIVMSNNSSNFSKARNALIAESNPGLSDLIGGTSEKKLKTEVKILESPSILKPVYEMVKEYKKQEGVSVKKFNFEDWREDSLVVNLIKKTSVLDLRYRDNSKELIQKVIEKISRDYQLYSGRDREKGLNLGLKYLTEQINLYTPRSAASIRKAQKYAIEQDLYPLQEENSKGLDKEVKEYIDIERIRVEAANKLRNIDYKLDQLSTLGNDPNNIKFFGKLTPEINDQGLPKLLDEIDAKLALYSSQFKSNDEIITKLLKKRDIYIQLLKEQAEGYLKALKIDTQARLSSTERPEGVLIKYKALLREASRDQLVLTQLENDRQLLALEKARSEDPWQLITDPTISDEKVYPNKTKMILLGLVIGTFLSAALTLLEDKRRGQIFYFEQLKNLFPYKFLVNLEIEKDNLEVQPLNLLMSSRQLKEIKGKTYLYNPGERNSIFEEKILSCIKNENKDIKFINDLSNLNNENIIIIFIGGFVTFKQVDKLINSLDFVDVNVIGWLFINNFKS